MVVPPAAVEVNVVLVSMGPLPADFPWPIVIAQHMPASFTGALARRLDKLTPLTVNSGSEVPMEETVTELPDAVRLAVWLVLVPTTTEPKLTEPGATDNWPCVASLPDSGMLTVGLLAFDRTLRLPEALPDVVGVNVTLNV